jgi:cellulose biosynthesis protein BcsQ
MLSDIVRVAGEKGPHAGDCVRVAERRRGKTTSAFLFSTAIAGIYDITLIDADPKHPIRTWAEGGNTPPRMAIVSDADEDTIIERIEDAASKTAFVVVDLEGTASMTVMKALSQADFVVITVCPLTRKIFLEQIG